MEFIGKDSIKKLTSDFQESYQLLWGENSSSERVTITKVYVYPGKTNERHIHQSSEQIWIALKGKATLLLADNQTKEFVYLSITSPPINFRYAYDK